MVGLWFELRQSDLRPTFLTASLCYLLCSVKRYWNQLNFFSFKMPASPVFSPFPRHLHAPFSSPASQHVPHLEYLPLLFPIPLSLPLASGALFSCIASYSTRLPFPCSPPLQSIFLTDTTVTSWQKKERGTEGGRESLLLYDIKAERLQQILEQTRQICFKYFCRS